MHIKFTLPLFIALFFCMIRLGHAEDIIKIGWIGPLTGDNSIVGVDSVEVLRQQIDAANGRGGISGKKLLLVAEDDQYQAPKAVTSYNKLAHQGQVKIIFMLTYSGMLAVAKDAAKNGVLLINPLDCDEELAALPENSFCVAKRTEDLGVMNANHAIRKGNTPAAIFYFEADRFMPKAAKATKDALTAAGKEVLLYEGGAKELDFASLVMRAKNKGAKAMFFYGLDYFGSAMKQGRHIGFSGDYYSLTNIDSPGYKAAAGETIKGIYAAGWFAPRTLRLEEFVTTYKQKVGRGPFLEIASIPTYDIMSVLLQALPEAVGVSGHVDTRNVMRSLYALKDYEGLSGTLTMDPDGAVRTLKVGMYRYNGATFEPAHQE